MNRPFALSRALDFAQFRPATTPQCTQSAHELATITKLKSGHWRVQVRRKQSYASETFLRHEDARKWAIATERRIDLGEAPRKAAARDPTLFAHLVDLHVQGMCEVDKAPADRSSLRSMP